MWYHKIEPNGKEAMNKNNIDFIKENNLYFNTKVLEQPVFKNSLKVFKLYDPQKNTSIRNFFIFNEPNYEEFENNAFQYSYGLLKKLPDGYSINFDFVIFHNEEKQVLELKADLIISPLERVISNKIAFAENYLELQIKLTDELIKYII